MPAHGSHPGVQFAVDSLAAFRLTQLVTKDAILKPARDKLIDGGHTGVYDFVTCPWCVGMWAAFGVAVAGKIAPRSWQRAGRVLAMAAVAGIIGERT